MRSCLNTMFSFIVVYSTCTDSCCSGFWFLNATTLNIVTSRVCRQSHVMTSRNRRAVYALSYRLHIGHESLNHLRYLASYSRTNRQTDTSTDNKGRLKLAARDPIFGICDRGSRCCVDYCFAWLSIVMHVLGPHAHLFHNVDIGNWLIQSVTTSESFKFPPLRPRSRVSIVKLNDLIKTLLYECSN